MMVIDISLDMLPLMLRWSAVNDKQISIYIYIYMGHSTVPPKKGGVRYPLISEPLNYCGFDLVR